jgi:hypothetical protein
MSTGMRATMARMQMQMQMQMRREKHPKPLMVECRMWRTEGIVRDVDGYECDNADADKEE